MIAVWLARAVATACVMIAGAGAVAGLAAGVTAGMILDPVGAAVGAAALAVVSLPVTAGPAAFAGAALALGMSQLRGEGVLLAQARGYRVRMAAFGGVWILIAVGIAWAGVAWGEANAGRLAPGAMEPVVAAMRAALARGEIVKVGMWRVIATGEVKNSEAPFRVVAAGGNEHLGSVVLWGELASGAGEAGLVIRKGGALQRDTEGSRAIEGRFDEARLPVARARGDWGRWFGLRAIPWNPLAMAGVFALAGLWSGIALGRISRIGR